MAGDRISLSEACTLITRGITPSYVEKDGVIVINQRCIRNQSIQWGNIRFHNSNKKAVSAEKLLKEGDVLVNSTGVGTLGRVAQFFGLDNAATVDSHVTILRPNTELINSKYFGFCIRGLEKYIETLGEGSTGQTELSRDKLKTLEIYFPSPLEQKAIADVLSALDDKIELNQRMNETLEGIARTLFKDWFIDFGPVKAKAAGQTPPGLDEEIAALFPDALDEEGVPVSWKITKLNEIIEFNPSERLPAGKSASYLDMASLPTTGSWTEKPIQRVAGSGMKFRNGDTLFARITPCLENGKAAYIQCLNENEVAWGSTEFIVLRPKTPWPKELGYLLARDNSFRKFAIQSMTGTSGRQRAQASQIANYELSLPVNNEIPLAFGEVVRSLFLQIKSNCEENHLLSCLRDMLLPKLISGEIRVQDVENQLEEVS